MLPGRLGCRVPSVEVERPLLQKIRPDFDWAHQGFARPGIAGIERCFLSIRSMSRSDSARARLHDLEFGLRLGQA